MRRGPFLTLAEPWLLILTVALFVVSALFSWLGAAAEQHFAGASSTETFGGSVPVVGPHNQHGILYIAYTLPRAYKVGDSYDVQAVIKVTGIAAAKRAKASVILASDCCGNIIADTPSTEMLDSGTMLGDTTMFSWTITPASAGKKMLDIKLRITGIDLTVDGPNDFNIVKGFPMFPGGLFRKFPIYVQEPILTILRDFQPLLAALIGAVAGYILRDRTLAKTSVDGG